MKNNEIFNLNYWNKQIYIYQDCRLTLLNLITFNNVLLQIDSRDVRLNIDLIAEIENQTNVQFTQ